MKKIKKNWASGGLIGVLLTLLGFGTGCDGGMEYGSPYADYQVRGTVRSSVDNTPLAHVKVKAMNRGYNDKYYDLPEKSSVSAITDNEGNFELKVSDQVYSIWEKTLPLEVSEPDLIKTDTVDVVGFPDQIKPGKKWYGGTYLGKIDIKVDPKK